MQYAVNNPKALPGMVANDTCNFYPEYNIPYAILSKLSKLKSTNIDGPAWESHYDGNLPFQTGVYFDSIVRDAFKPNSYLKPEEDGLISLSIANEQQQSDLPILDLSILSTSQEPTVEVELNRKAKYASETGFF